MEKVAKKPIRVLQIGMHDKIGGVEIFLMNYYRNINRNNVTFDFISATNELCFQDELKKYGSNIYYVSNYKRNPIKYYNEIKKIIKEGKYEIVHINMLSAANVLPAIAAKKCKVKNIIAHSHNNGVPSGLLRKVLNNLNKKMLRKCANIFYACSESAGKWMFKNKQFDIIENSIEIDKYRFNHEFRDKLRKEYHIPKDKIVIGMVGRFDEQKNHEFAIDILKNLNDDKYVLFLIGEGVLKESIKNKASDLKLENNVIFAGKKMNVEEYYSMFDLFILPSKFEGFGIVNIEAQASGLPCVVSSVVPLETKLSDSIYYLGLDNIDEWIKTIKKIKYDRDRTKLADDIYNYDIKTSAKKLEDRYLNMINR